ncbi:MAG: helix-turn-helix transcriptional regulator, partial [Paracoccaceae bacterium]
NRMVADFSDAGEHDLKNIPRPIRVYHWSPVLAEERGAPARPASENTSPSVPPSTNLPHELSTFLGRDDELAGVLQSIDEHRLVTLTGAGGVGKTRLALKAAHRRIGAYRDGVWFIELASVTRAEGVPVAVARVLDLREEASVSLTDMLVRELAQREMLLIFDNCEQVLDACAEFVERVLKAAPGVRVLATSREPLGVMGEMARGVPPLDTTDGVALFCERARQAVSDFDSTASEASAIEAIVARLDGLPLAIELAAARIQMMPPARILAGLDDRFRLLTSGARGALDHQKTLEASVTWSYELLEPAERLLAQRLSVLHGFTLEAAEALGLSDTNESGSVFDQLARLVDKSLVQVDRSGGEPRFRLLETVRQFLLTRLADAGEMNPMRARHMTHFLALAEELAPRLALSDGPECLARLQTEFDNLEDALSFAEESSDKADLLRFVVALTLFYELRGHLAHGWRWFERALAANPDQTVLRARALWGAAHVCFYGGRYPQSVAYANESHEAALAVDDKWALARALNTIGVLQSLATPILARETLLQSVAIGRAINDDWAVADGLKMVTVAWYFLHDNAGAQDAMAELETAGSALQSRFFLAWHQAMVGYFARDAGDLAAAAKALQLSLDHSHYVGDPSTGGFSEAWSAALDADFGKIDNARARLLRLLDSAAVSGSDLAVPEALFALGRIELGEGNSADVLKLLGNHVSELREAGVPSWASQLAVVQAAAHCELGESDLATKLLAEAQTMIEPLRHPIVEGLVRFEHARIARANGSDGEAEDWLHGALEVQCSAGLRPDMVRSLEALAAMLVRRNRHAEAAQILSVTAAERARIGLVPGKVDVAANTSLVMQVRQAIGDAEFEKLCAKAVNTELAEIVEFVSRARGKRGRPLSGWQSLTPTERRAVSLVAEGLTNPQIAERMFIARGTVKIHLAHVFDKLDVSSRTQLATMAVTEGFSPQS